MNDKLRDLIKMWFYKSKEMENPFDQFIFLWISFNAFYAHEHLREKESSQLKIFRHQFKKLFREVVTKNDATFKEFKHYIDTKPVNTGFIQDLRFPVDEERHKQRYSDLTSLCEYIDCVYQVRCNLFHGGKSPEDGQDENIVKHAYNSLVVFCKAIYQKEGILNS